MKPHTRIIYYTLLCLALNQDRSKACIYGGMKRERALYVFCLHTYFHNQCVHANLCMSMFAMVCVYIYVKLCIIIMYKKTG